MTSAYLGVIEDTGVGMDHDFFDFLITRDDPRDISSQQIVSLICTLDDSEALMAKGLENASRQDLSFYERARFAQAILDRGHSREEAQQALSISKNTLSQLECDARLVPDLVVVKIGPAPGAGRPKWMALASAFDAGQATEDAAFRLLATLNIDMPSDARFEAVLNSLSKRGASQLRVVDRNPVAGTAVKLTGSSVTLTIKRAGQNKAFADWFDSNIDRLLKESYQTFQDEAGEEGS